MNAFTELNTTRPPGFQVITEIPWDKIMAYADRMGLNHSNSQSFLRIIRAMDAEFRGMIEKKRPEPPNPDDD